MQQNDIFYSIKSMALIFKIKEKDYKYMVNW